MALGALRQSYASTQEQLSRLATAITGDLYPAS